MRKLILPMMLLATTASAQYTATWTNARPNASVSVDAVNPLGEHLIRADNNGNTNVRWVWLDLNGNNVWNYIGNADTGDLIRVLDMQDNALIYSGVFTTNTFEVTRSITGGVTVAEIDLEGLPLWQPVKSHPRTRIIARANGDIVGLELPPQATQIAPSTFTVTGASVQLDFATEAGRAYQVQSSTNLVSWLDVGLPINGNGQAMSWTTTLPSADTSYRLTTN